jgi:polyhydroxyalkanoate synthesis repressor PhaR
MAKAKPLDSGEGGAPSVAIVKKYANRRLYNTASSSYVTLEELSQMVREGHDFLVYDAKSGEDITRSVLTQIILEEDSKGRNLLPIGFLRQLISFYDDQLHAFLPRYLEVSMENFSSHQDQIRTYMEQTFGRFFPMSQFEDMARQNMALFQRAATMWTPFPPDSGEEIEQQASRPSGPQPVPFSRPTAASEEVGGEMRAIKRRLEEMQQEIEAMRRPRGGGES